MRRNILYKTWTNIYNLIFSIFSTNTTTINTNRNTQVFCSTKPNNISEL